ncbi:MAG: Nif3-like dinuclear metal center hexameric protein [Nanobdellota archaeon]
MNSKYVYNALEKDFISSDMTDDWQDVVEPIRDYVTSNYKEKNIGLVCDFTKEINKVFTCVFASKPVMQKVLDLNIKNSLLFCHHPANWDIRQAPKVFQPMEKELLDEFKRRNISVYNLHVPLDNFNDFGTSVTLARAIGLEPTEKFGFYFGSYAGVLCDSNNSLEETKGLFSNVLGHSSKLYQYGSSSKKIAVVAGGGLDYDILKEASPDLLITGVTTKNDFSRKAHEYAEKQEINVLGGTHYSTEKFSMIAMAEYFKHLNLEAEFLKDTPILEDM